jgi:hypothetical protein
MKAKFAQDLKDLPAKFRGTHPRLDRSGLAQLLLRVHTRSTC